MSQRLSSASAWRFSTGNAAAFFLTAIYKTKAAHAFRAAFRLSGFALRHQAAKARNLLQQQGRRDGQQIHRRRPQNAPFPAAHIKPEGIQQEAHDVKMRQVHAEAGTRNGAQQLLCLLVLGEERPVMIPEPYKHGHGQHNAGEAVAPTEHSVHPPPSE